MNTSRIGIVAGSGGASSAAQIEASDIARERGPKRIGPYAVTKTMGSTVSAILGTTLKLKGVNYSISSACSTSAHCIGHAAELIQLGKQDIIIAGGAEQEHWTSSSMFDAMGALSSQYNHLPEKASRPFDVDRDGFVIAGGAGMLILEEEEHAIKRNVPIIARLKGYCANSDGYDMVSPSGEGAKRCMSEALEAYGSDVDYINAHGTSTPVGDLAELSAIKTVFGKNAPVIGSTKSMTGHSLGATGAQEAIYSILMMQHDFIAPSINIETLVEEAEGLNICQSMMKQKLNSVMSNSFGFGGTNASLIFGK
jgi:3-oxoacyl-[acyl-carrier-protein] synthase-1